MSCSVFRGDKLYYWCSACKSMTSVPAKRWNWNGSLDKPTLAPSVRETCGPFPDGKILCCHYFLIEGVMQYCGDCTHAFKNMSVPLPDLDTVITIVPKEEEGLQYHLK